MIDADFSFFSGVVSYHRLTDTEGYDDNEGFARNIAGLSVIQMKHSVFKDRIGIDTADTRYINFSDSIFKAEAYFHLWEVTDAFFMRVVFEKEADFSGGKIENSFFSEAIFNERADFSSTRLGLGAFDVTTVFKKGASFNKHSSFCAHIDDLLPLHKLLINIQKRGQQP